MSRGSRRGVGAPGVGASPAGGSTGGGAVEGRQVRVIWSEEEEDELT